MGNEQRQGPAAGGGTTATGDAARIETLSLLAIARTSFSSDRALMAWMRTSTSLYSFGFSITKFVDYLEKRDGGLASSAGPDRLGFALVLVGILVLLPATIEYVWRLRKMKSLGLATVSRIPPPVVIATGLLLVGIATLIAIASNMPT